MIMTKGAMLRGYLRSDARRAFGGSGFWICILVTALVQWNTIGTEFSYDEAQLTSAVHLFRLSAEVGTMQWLMPCVAAMAYSTAFFGEWNSRYCRMTLIRGNETCYAISKLIVCAGAAFLAVFLGMLLFVGALSVFCPFSQASDAQWLPCSFGNWLNEGKPQLMVFAQCVVRGMGAALWAVAALAVSALFPNRFVILLFPILLYYAWEHADGWIWANFNGFITLRYLELSNTKLMSPARAFLRAILTFGTFTLLWAVAFRAGLRWRLRNG